MIATITFTVPIASDQVDTEDPKEIEQMLAAAFNSILSENDIAVDNMLLDKGFEYGIECSPVQVTVTDLGENQ